MANKNYDFKLRDTIEDKIDKIQSQIDLLFEKVASLRESVIKLEINSKKDTNS